MLAQSASLIFGLLSLSSVLALPIPSRPRVARQVAETNGSADVSNATAPWDATAWTNGTKLFNATALCSSALLSNETASIANVTLSINGTSTSLAALCNGTEWESLLDSNVTATITYPSSVEDDGMEDCEDDNESSLSASTPVATSDAATSNTTSSAGPTPTSSTAEQLAVVEGFDVASIVFSAAATAGTSGAIETTLVLSTSIELASMTITTSAGPVVTSPALAIPGALSSPQIDEYLAKHNAVRQRYKAVDLTWDATVAAAAQTYAEKCIWGHSGNHLYGENIAAGTDLSISDTVNMWAGEESTFNFAAPTYNHLTQLVWKSTTTLGCGIADCLDPDTHAPFKMHVCNYAEPGNMLGEFAANVAGVTCTGC